MNNHDSTALDGTREWLGRYVRTMHDGDLDLLTLWAAHTHLAFETYSSPRLLLDSPLPGSGKTTVLEHLQRLCLDPVQMATVSSASLLVRILQDDEGNSRIRTLLVDEVDRTLRPDGDMTADLLAVLNSGYKRGATRPVNVPDKGKGWRVAEMPTYAPVALAGNSPTLPDDTRSRTIRVLLLPDLDGRVEESDWELIEDDARLMGTSLAEWADRVRPIVASTRPQMPEGVTGRMREKWQPLARVAFAAGGRWPGVVDALAVGDLRQTEADRMDGMLTEKPHIILLRHLAAAWPAGETFMRTQHIVDELAMLYPDSWGANDRFPKGLTVQRFGKMMALHYKVNAGRLPDEARTRGYFLEDVLPVFDRMGIDPPNKPDEPTNPVKPVAQSPNPTGSTDPTGSSGLKWGTPQPVDTHPEKACKSSLPNSPASPNPENGEEARVARMDSGQSRDERPATNLVCGVCRLPLPDCDIVDGFTTHAGCAA